ncbi:rhomboid family intramembrane serine protease [Arthrobacter sulfonylureivorans]|uniref:Rhomboid family intramembrane serine protease n=1 Tax=Arthrobacter sulfonylureivorans TaxID=2486855 RepID=A0ABY3WBC7_9MICC|nr:rhomboid family intramembrane serine protease [Arthrobacter sulfonylureivorans]UNK45034.1 rhomboid family intramembrane serine protease [Arthrobacter sulfonylureivorans]
MARSRALRPAQALAGAGAFAVLLWVAFLVNLIAGGYFSLLLGIAPRRLDGLDGVLFGPLLHADTSHLLSNTLPLLVLGFLTLLEGIRRFLVVLACSWLASGLGVWLTGAGVTIGASGLVFGLLAYLLVRGFYNRSWRQMLLAVVIFIFYGSVLWGVLPTAMPGVSWQAHLFGAAGGVVAAVLLRRRRPHLG